MIRFMREYGESGNIVLPHAIPMFITGNITQSQNMMHGFTEAIDISDCDVTEWMNL